MLLSLFAWLSFSVEALAEAFEELCDVFALCCSRCEVVALAEVARFFADVNFIVLPAESYVLGVLEVDSKNCWMWALGVSARDVLLGLYVLLCSSFHGLFCSLENQAWT